MNDLQRLFKARKLSMQQLADQLGLYMTSVQKTIKGDRQAPHIQQAVAGFLGLTVDQCFGPEAPVYLHPLIELEIKKRRSEFEKKLKAKLFDSHRVSVKQRVVNG
ncbi:MAG: helix-turn-helix domain-containing protein [Deltaproteobacteria bacterium]|jgi:transcriptional regulator with XRE-family HTH domain|nr:helix-turn-helix domain-containing protein [Deltaproteobacteria bacterium]